MKNLKPLDFDSLPTRVQGPRRKDCKLHQMSTPEPQLSATTLTLSRKGNDFLVGGIDVSISALSHPIDDTLAYKLKFQQYVEAVKSLLHNVNFVLLAQNIGDVDNNGKEISCQSIRKLNIEYNRAIRNCFTSTSKLMTIKKESDLIPFILHTLEESEKIVNEIEKDLDIASSKQHIPNIEEVFAKTKDFKDRILITNRAIISALENGRINLDKFSNRITFNPNLTSYHL